MINLKLKDGSVKSYESGITVIEVARDISEGLGRVACAGTVDGETVDLRYKLTKDCELSILTFDSEEGKKAFRHTAAHILAQAVKRLFPATKLAIGPSIDDGFYYDFDKQNSFSAEDIKLIEAEMKKIIKEDLPIERFELPRAEAISFMGKLDENFKVQLIEDLPVDEKLSFYKQGEFTDLCAGPHLMSTKYIKAFKLTQVAGAYWRGNEKNKIDRKSVV